MTHVTLLDIIGKIAKIGKNCNENNLRELTVPGDADEVGIPKTNTWYFNGYDTDECFDKYFENPTDHKPPTVYLGFPCTKVSWPSSCS